MNLINTSRYMSIILRYKPEVIGIRFDEQRLIPKNRLNVHLSKDEDTVLNVGERAVENWRDI